MATPLATPLVTIDSMTSSSGAVVAPTEPPPPTAAETARSLVERVNPKAPCDRAALLACFDDPFGGYGCCWTPWRSKRNGWCQRLHTAQAGWTLEARWVETRGRLLRMHVSALVVDDGVDRIFMAMVPMPGTNAFLAAVKCIYPEETDAAIDAACVVKSWFPGSSIRLDHVRNHRFTPPVEVRRQEIALASSGAFDPPGDVDEG